MCVCQPHVDGWVFSLTLPKGRVCSQMKRVRYLAPTGTAGSCSQSTFPGTRRSVKSTAPRHQQQQEQRNSPRQNQMNLVHNSKVSATERSDAYPKNKNRNTGRKGEESLLPFFGGDTVIVSEIRIRGDVRGTPCLNKETTYVLRDSIYYLSASRLKSRSACRVARRPLTPR